MAITLPSLAALDALPFDAVIDVRSPSEFAEDRMPGAINLPVLDDAERARVGTIYKQDSAFLARKLGAALVARNAATHVEGPLRHHEGGWRPLVYCWRGGQRSGSFAAILGQIGWRVDTVEGGYRAYRALVKAALYDAPVAPRIVLLDGYTGTAKTELLHRAADRGAQILDLEGLANHRGSVFGHRAAPQPAQKGFESALAAALGALDPGRPVLVEAESSKVGAIALPPMLWKAMRDAPRITVAAPVAARADYLARAYADVTSDPARLDGILSELVRLQGHDRISEWRAMAREGRMRALAEALVVHHYDPRYGAKRRRDGAGGPDTIALDALGPSDLDRAADRIVARLAAAG